MPGALLLDFYGTLTDPAAEDERADAHARTAAAFGVTAAEFAEAMGRSWPERVVGTLGDTVATFRALAAGLGVDPDGPVPTRAAETHRAATAVLRRPHRAALALLRGLRDRGLPVAVVSDCTADLPETWADTPYAPLVDATVFSCAQGYRKPDERMYRTAAERLGVTVAECWFVGDGGSRELTGAARVGARPVLVRNLHYPTAAAHRTDVDDFTSGTAIDDLGDLLALVDACREST